MKVKRSSWHYKLHRFVRDPWPSNMEGPRDFFRLSSRKHPHLPKSLCGYFWSTVALAAIYPILMTLTGVGLLVLLICFGIYRVAIRPFQERYDRKKRERAEELERKEAEVWERYNREEITYDEAWREIDILRRRIKPPKEKGLVRQYLSAAKQKACPLIEVVEE